MTEFKTFVYKIENKKKENVSKKQQPYQKTENTRRPIFSLQHREKISHLEEYIYHIEKGRKCIHDIVRVITYF